MLVRAKIKTLGADDRQMSTSTKKTSTDIPEVLSSIAIIVVVILVLAGFIRLVTIHWGYAVLVLFVLGACYLIYSLTKK